MGVIAECDSIGSCSFPCQPSVFCTEVVNVSVFVLLFLAVCRDGQCSAQTSSLLSGSEDCQTEQHAQSAKACYLRQAAQPGSYPAQNRGPKPYPPLDFPIVVFVRRFRASLYLCRDYLVLARIHISIHFNQQLELQILVYFALVTVLLAVRIPPSPPRTVLSSARRRTCTIRVSIPFPRCTPQLNHPALSFPH